MSMIALGAALLALPWPPLVVLEPQTQAAAEQSAAGPRLELRAMDGRGDPAALAVSQDEATVFSADGTHIRLLSGPALRAGKLEVLGQVEVDAAIVGLCAMPDLLLVAGGSQGLFSVDLSAKSPSATPVEDLGDMVCTAVAAEGDLCYATFAAKDKSLLLVYEGRPLKRIAEVRLGPGTAWAMALDASGCYLAMGTGGLVRVRAAATKAERQPGPSGAQAFPAPPGLQLTPGYVRDLAIDGGQLWVAGDAGLLQIDLKQPWSPSMPVVVHGLSSGGEATYACRVAARDGWIAVGTNLAPNEALDGAPYCAYGYMGRAVTVGGVDPKLFVRGRSEQLHLMRWQAGELRPKGRVDLQGGWRGLILGQGTLYEQHIKEGLVVRALDRDQATLRVQLQPTGLPSSGGHASVRQPGSWFVGFDSAGSVPAGQPVLTEQGLRIDTCGAAAPANLGVNPGAPWPGALEGEEWLVGGVGLEIKLFRMKHGAGLCTTSWELPQPTDSLGNVGRTYFHAVARGDLLLVSRYGTKAGLLAYSTAELMAEAAALPDGLKLRTKPKHVVETDSGAGPGSKRVMRLALVDLPDGRLVAALAGGPADKAGDALLQLYDVTHSPAEPPKLLGAVPVPSAECNALGLAVAQVDKRAWVFVADASFGLRAFDVTEPEKPQAGASWEVGPNAFDGKLDTPIDVVHQGSQLYVAFGRLGVVCLDASNPAGKALAPLEIHDTPGMAYGVCVLDYGGQPHLAVSDHQAGLRVYRIRGQ